MTEITCEEPKDFVSKTSYIGELHSLYTKRDLCLAVMEYMQEWVKPFEKMELPNHFWDVFEKDKALLRTRISELDNRIKEVEKIVRR